MMRRIDAAAFIVTFVSAVVWNARRAAFPTFCMPLMSAYPSARST